MLALTLCSRQHIHIVHRRERHDTTEERETRHHRRKRDTTPQNTTALHEQEALQVGLLLCALCALPLACPRSHAPALMLPSNTKPFGVIMVYLREDEFCMDCTWTRPALPLQPKPTRVCAGAWLAHRPSVRGRTNWAKWTRKAHPLLQLQLWICDIIAIMDPPQIPGDLPEGNECLSAEQICTNMYKMNCGCQTCYGKAV